MMELLGIDVGGTGIKGAIVDVNSGTLLTERLKLKTKKPANPASVGNQVLELIDLLGYNGDNVGIGFPSVIKNGISLTASNVDDEWLNYPIRDHFAQALNKDVYMINDADAAGIAEFTFTDTIPKKGLTIVLTIGTGIGSAFFYNGVLVPNTEFGQLNYKKGIAEHYVSNAARENGDLSWEEWGKELNKYIKHLDYILRPELFILGGGVSKKLAKYKKYLTVETPVISATLLNQAGVIGAALAAYRQLSY